MTAIDKLLSLAAAEVGYLEKKSNADLDDKIANAGHANYTKYARDLDAIKGFYNGRKQGSSWCDVFVDWLFVMTFGVELALKLLCQAMGGCGAGVKYSAQYFMAKGRFFETGPKPGDQIFFVKRKGLTIISWLHTGIVEKVSGSYVYTIEGNTSGTGGVVSNGGGVCRKVYDLNDVSIGGYGRPDWNLVKEDNEMTEKEIEALVEKKVNEAVKPLDEALCKAIRGLEGKVYTTVAELPTWAQPVVDRLMSEGIITGDGSGKLHLTDRDLVTAAMVDKLWLAVIGNEA